MKTCGSRRHEGERTIDINLFAPCERKKKGNGTCRECVRKQAAEWRATNKEASKATYSKHYQKNKEKILEKHRELQPKNNEYAQKYRDNNKQKRAEITKRWRDKNKVLTCFLANARRARKLQATPKWVEAEREQIEAIYREAARLQQETGIVHNVDHIIPLQSELVCGLHCLANLQILTQTENIKKSNKFDPNAILEP